MRHGETFFNQMSKIQGWCDSPLTKKGVEQACIAGHYFEREQINLDAAYSSTSERACDTLEKVTDMPYKRVKGLKEWNFGRFEGEHEYLNPELPYRDFFVQFDGEGEDEVQKRISDCLLKIMQGEDGKNVLAVSHGATCGRFAANWAHKSNVFKNAPVANCCVFVYEFENNEFTLLEIVNHDFSTIDG
uniref:histidine phosphatase family protein n=1 Tax=Tetragenococcus halophilus TaxID=51669 RepID=UPI0024E15F83|nr:histidine phosphatase family protein [Tetragenococcus halophilus]